MFLVERRGGILMGAIWILFIPFLVIIYASSEKKIKKLNKRIKRLEKQVKGNQEMSRLLEELKGQTVKVTVNGFRPLIVEYLEYLRYGLIWFLFVVYWSHDSI